MNSQEDTDPLTASPHPALRAPLSQWERGWGEGGLRVAVLHNLKENAPRHAVNGQRPEDALAELDSQRNVADYAAAIRALGHQVVMMEGNADLPRKLAEHPVDICFNTCEGFRGDSREAQVPALLEMMGVPYTASKVLALAITLDKTMTKRVLAYHGLPTPRFQEFRDPAEPLDPRLRFPLFAKPNREGTGIGIHGDAILRTETALREKVDYLLKAYQETVLVEEYVEGRDVTCGLVGNLRPDGSFGDDLHLFPISEVDYSVYAPGTQPFYSYELKVDLADDYHSLCPAPIPAPIAAEVRRLTVETFHACGCLDVSRVDFRLDARPGNNLQPVILEINALPGLAWNSDLTLCAEAEGWTHYQLLQRVLNAALKRHGFYEKVTSVV
ncbi:MAG: D-alanine--D-alanine ligase family protein [Anaerolineales bacterium]